MHSVDLLITFFRENFLKTYEKLTSLSKRMNNGSDKISESDKEINKDLKALQDIKKGNDPNDVKVIDESFKEVVYKIMVQKINVVISETSNTEDVLSQHESDTVQSSTSTPVSNTLKNDLINGTK